MLTSATPKMRWNCAQPKIIRDTISCRNGYFTSSTPIVPSLQNLESRNYGIMNVLNHDPSNPKSFGLTMIQYGPKIFKNGFSNVRLLKKVAIKRFGRNQFQVNTLVFKDS